MEPDRQHDGPQRVDRAPLRAPGSGLTIEEIRSAVVPRLSSRRLEHVESVVETVARVTRAWEAERRAAAERAAWYHDAWKGAPIDDMVAAIREGGEEPDPWSLRYAPALVHAHAGAVWAARTLGETDASVLAAVRHHPTGHPAWGNLGRALYVADFCEPGRPHAAEVGADGIVARAATGPEGLADAALDVLALRLRHALRSPRPIHPESWRAWNAWTEAVEP